MRTLGDALYLRRFFAARQGSECARGWQVAGARTEDGALLPKFVAGGTFTQCYSGRSFELGPRILVMDFSTRSSCGWLSLL
jgi:hypothetical protein